jgi:hypothetical protein
METKVNKCEYEGKLREVRKYGEIMILPETGKE